MAKCSMATLQRSCKPEGSSWCSLTRDAVPFSLAGASSVMHLAAARPAGPSAGQGASCAPMHTLPESSFRLPVPHPFHLGRGTAPSQIQE